jgi:prepilin-type processing-associated H-X9-DG protein
MGEPIMNTTMSLSEEATNAVAAPAPEARHRKSQWFACRLRVAVAGLAMLAAALGVIVLGVFRDIRELRRARCAEQLKGLGSAIHEYLRAKDHFPAPAITSAGRPLLSWRVALLPYLGYRSLYDRFHLDEPWDSPHNRALLPEMPVEYGCPSGPGRRHGRTGYLVIVGPVTEFGSASTAFQPGRGVDIREITDGSSNTFLVLETDTRVPWTKPDDLNWQPGGPLPRLVSPHQGGTHALFADGSTRFIRAKIEPSKLLGLLTINGGEVLSDS